MAINYCDSVIPVGYFQILDPRSQIFQIFDQSLHFYSAYAFLSTKVDAYNYVIILDERMAVLVEWFGGLFSRVVDKFASKSMANQDAQQIMYGQNFLCLFF